MITLTELTEKISSALAQFSSASRLYALTVGDGSAELGSGGLLVEAFAADDMVQGIGGRDVIVVSTDAHISLAPLLGQPASLEVSLADGSRTRFDGDISEVAMLGSEGGLARYRLRMAPWMWRLGQVRNSRVWQDKSVVDIVEDVFAAYAPVAKWRWSDEAGPFMDGAVARSYCCQYRESDLDFVQRLLTEEGLSWRFEQTEDGPGAVLFADTSQLTAIPEDPSSERDGGIRFHNVRAGEKQDTVQALRAQRSIGASLTTVLSYDYKSKQAVGASMPSRLPNGSMMPELESFDVPGQYAYANSGQAQRYAEIQMQGKEARGHLWRGRSTLRTLRAGTRLTIIDAPLQQLGDTPAFAVLRVASVGVNNLPSPAQQALAELFGPIPELLQEIVRDNEPEEFSLVVAQARKSGYANYFEAVAADVVWRAQLAGSDGRSHPRPTAPGAQSAIVVGADGNDQASGADELYCDRFGRVRIRFHWQDNADATCWVRVAQRSAGGGMGSQFLPRIGQEVFVQFLENDIDRPIIVGALYNGQGEGGVAPTPGGRADGEDQSSRFDPAHDHAPSAQGNVAGGNSPVWHGASGDSKGHRNSAAQWGVRSKEFGASGYNQLLFDDTDAQGRIQLKSSHAATELNLGHLVHGADNFRGSLRGSGAELRTDAYGALRAGAGLLISSYKSNHSAASRDPAGDNAPGIAMLKQAVMLGETFSKAATTHNTVALASHEGASKANASALDEKAAPLKAMLKSVSGMVAGTELHAAKTDASKKNTSAGADKLPHASDAIIAIAAKAGLGVVAGQSMQLANGETVTLISGQDTQFITGGQMRMHTGQAIGMLGGAMKAGEGNLGLQLIAAKDAIDIQAQAGTLTVQARDEVNVISANAHIDWAAAKSITLSTAGGANITIDGGNILVQCPGKILIHAGKKSFTAPERTNYKLPVLPVLVVLPSTACKLESTFAYDQLKQVAKTFNKAEFIALMVPKFGYDIPAHTYLKLYDGLRDGSIAGPPIKVMNGGHYPASFDNLKKTILVHQVAADRAAKDNDESGDLLVALIHEFGHYIDNLLRVDLADKDAHGVSTLKPDSEGDEGAAFAYGVAFFDFAESSETVYATYTSPKFTGPLRVNYHEVRELLKASQDEDAQKKEGKQGDVEHFGAGKGENHKKNPNGSFGHQSIEFALRDSHNKFKNDVILHQIYFGNWLRDYSQVLDPAIVRRAGAPLNFPKILDRDALTELVDILAFVEFVDEDIPSDLALFKVTKERLGVYKPVEHIDNPTNNDPKAGDPRKVDTDFQAPASKTDLAVDPATSMKRYVGYSRDYMTKELNAAVAAGATPAGYRHFGAALHVLEDYFAHSNFVELSLRKVGYTKVLPWTSPVAGKHKYPLVTGMFNPDDVIASTAGTLADLLFKVEWEHEEKADPYKHTAADKIIIVLLREHNEVRYLRIYKQWIQIRGDIYKLPPKKWMRYVIHYTIGMVGTIHSWVYSTLMHALGNSVDDVQVEMKGDPNKNGSTDPSHSQLAKDHDNHPFHTLAATLAKHAVREVGKKMSGRWWDGRATDNPAALAASFLVHPLDTDWQDAMVKKWALGHPQQLIDGEDSTLWARLEKAHKEEVQLGIKKTQAKSKATWEYINENFEAIFGEKNKVTTGARKKVK
jgi:type VI secretion system secreted protein VgrG